jgi:hypothetical protein
VLPDYKDIYIKYDGHPRFHSEKIIEDDVVETIVQKLEMVLFSDKGSLLGAPDYGCNLEYFLWETKVPSTNLKTLISNQINLYIPELNTIGYSFNLELYEGSFRDILYLNFVIKGYNYELLMK